MTDENPVADAAETTTDKAKETVETVTDVAPEPIKETADNPTSDMPPWGKELSDKIDALAEAVTAIPVAAVEQGTEGTPLEMPNDGGTIEDENPLGLPWTHRGFGR